jgi:ribonuclease HI
VNSKNSAKWYVVWQGVKPGIYDKWIDCQKQVHGFKGALFKSFPSRELAESAFNNTLPTNDSDSLTHHDRPTLGIAVDAACSGNPGVLEYRGINIASGAEIFHGGPYQEGTNNLGEFLALVHGLRYISENNLKLPLYSDSQTGITWLNKGHANTSLTKNENTALLFAAIEEAIAWLKEARLKYQVMNIAIIKWDTNRWGEIPADFGRK